MGIALSIAATLAYIATGTLAGYAFFMLKKQESDIRGLRSDVRHALAVIIGEHLRASVSSLNDMKRDFEALVDAERYEDAERLKTDIGKAEESVLREIERYNESFGSMVSIDLKGLRKE